jgi:predicted ATPase/class 3 adenylate cyclase
VAELPSGTLTFLFTDLEGSTANWESDPQAMRGAVARHDELLSGCVIATGGHVVKTTGDGLVAVFGQATDAVAGALGCQQALAAEDWPMAITARMGMYTGEASPVDGDYHAPVLNRAARVMSAGHGGQVLLAGSTAAVVGADLPDGAGLVDLGEHRLRDLGRPEHLFELTHPDLSRDFAPLRTLDVLPSNLPLQLSSFVGREREQRAIVEALDRSRLVTLIGVGGVGKTRLALQSAAGLLPRFRDGVWLCELAALREPDRLAEVVAAALGVSERPGMSMQESLIAFLSDEQVLLVIDNCEHLLRPAARLIAAVQAACPSVSVLATGREGLSVAGEQLLMVAPLDIPDPDADSAAAATCEAVELFVERARSHRADFDLDDTNRGDVVGLCTRLDGLPLAIELAAARIPMMSPGEILRRLDRRFRLLSGGAQLGIERHQTLRAAVDWSYDLLEPDEAELLGRLSVFTGGWTLEAAETVCAGALIHGDDVLDLLGTLVARSLVVADAGEPTRYRMLETIRQYAEERLAEAEETDGWRARHADYFIESLRRTVRECGGPQQVEASHRFRRESENLVAAMDFAIQTSDTDRALALLIIGNWPWVLGDVFVLDPEPVLALPGVAGHALEPAALVAAARNAITSGDLAYGSQLIEESQAAQTALGVDDPRTDFMRAFSLALVHHGRLDHQESAAAFGRFAELALRADETGLAALGLASQAGVSEPDVTRGLAETARELALRSGMPLAIGNASLILAAVLIDEDPDRARSLLTGRDDSSYLGSDATVAFTAALLKDWPLALSAAEQSLQSNRRVGGLLTFHVAAMLNIASRALAPIDPEGAAVLQGGAQAILAPVMTEIQAGAAAAELGSANRFATALEAARYEARTLIIESIGEQRWRELRSQGQTMTRDQAVRHALAVIKKADPNHPGTAT